MEPMPLHAAERQAIARLAGVLGLPDLLPGWVWLAGAGPGDPGLVTALGLKALADADVVVYDALVNPVLLELASPMAERLLAGKRQGQPSWAQGDITHLLQSRAVAGLRVLRLKGGDPFVFGRGGEEALALAHAGVPFRIVPGVTAGIGGLAYAGIPLTHRDTNQSVTFITGHGADGALPALDWQALAKGAPTLIFFMALARAGEIAQRLIAAGRDGAEPAAILSAATTERQSLALTTLAALPAAAATMPGPALLVIGPNVAMAQNLAWFLTPASLDRSARRMALASH